MKNPAAMLLLMGGKSSRMGLDKAQLLFDGQPFWKKIADELSACGKVYLSISQTYDSAVLGGYPYIRDEIPDCGIMGGLYSAFHAIEEDLIFVCACDMPFMDHRFVQWILGRWEEDTHKGLCWDGIVVYEDGRRTYTTAALYHRRILGKLEENVREKRLRMHTFVREEANMLLLPMGEVMPFHSCFRNINTPEDYRRLAACGDFDTTPTRGSYKLYEKTV